MNWITELERLDELYRRGGLSRSEYAQAKSRLLSETPQVSELSPFSSAEAQSSSEEEENAEAATSSQSKGFVIYWIVMSAIVAFYGVRIWGPLARYAVVLAIFGVFVLVLQGKAIQRVRPSHSSR